MAHLGHPLIGDPVYGRDRKGFKSILETLGFKRQALHAKRLGFIHPVTGQNLSFDSALPIDMQELLSELLV
jgi:23S rRNA pseudouridine1911/1915/1917 synthase